MCTNPPSANQRIVKVLPKSRDSRILKASVTLNIGGLMTGVEGRQQNAPCKYQILEMDRNHHEH
ncbi:hypothetical protein MP228_006830 [Amoeboaphelidium protococcarum]|nr:hypothetical protein MP228_006830 [Amoeboaphelidium protococcarum]